ncbi:hypothetical protein ACFSQT_00625 [Mesorhizobium calcicola]|uniref:Uncharacterized protein n=1 Tax=Mesorhizobium calcicola TaxID=1300310 RepID=A0ABW4W6U9_9HYPH
MAEAGQADFEHELITVEEDWRKNTGDAVHQTFERDLRNAWPDG